MDNNNEQTNKKKLRLTRFSLSHRNTTKINKIKENFFWRVIVLRWAYVWDFFVVCNSIVYIWINHKPRVHFGYSDYNFFLATARRRDKRRLLEDCAAFSVLRIQRQSLIEWNWNTNHPKLLSYNFANKHLTHHWICRIWWRKYEPNETLMATKKIKWQIVILFSLLWHFLFSPWTKCARKAALKIWRTKTFDSIETNPPHKNRFTKNVHCVFWNI